MIDEPEYEAREGDVPVTWRWLNGALVCGVVPLWLARYVRQRQRAPVFRGTDRAVASPLMLMLGEQPIYTVTASGVGCALTWNTGRWFGRGVYDEMRPVVGDVLDRATLDRCAERLRMLGSMAALPLCRRCKDTGMLEPFDVSGMRVSFRCECAMGEKRCGETECVIINRRASSLRLQTTAHARRANMGGPRPPVRFYDPLRIRLALMDLGEAP